jgi:Kef-type K+ transport system membrane component KefB
MILLSELNFSLPLTNPVIIFSLMLFIILFAPILLNKIKIPHIIGLIIAGVLIGPYGFNLLLRDSSIVLFGTVGLLYIMFLAGLEIDLAEFNKNKFRSLLFGLYTFIFPFVLGYFASFYLLGFATNTSILLASMFSSQTLIGYPIVSRYGLTNNTAVTITVGGTMITDVLSLLFLAAIVGMEQGEITSSFWVTLSISVVLFVLVILVIFPLIARWFFKNYEDSVGQYIFVLAMVFMGGFLAELAGIEAIIGAFLSGLALNKFIPHNSALMNRIGFVGNAIFIPFFLVGVGMLVDVGVLVKGWGPIKVAAVMICVEFLGKFIGAWLTRKTFRLKPVEGKLIFGLSSASAAATLASVLVGYNVILGEMPNGDPIRLLNDDVLNGTILLILISCTVSSLVVESAARRLANEAMEGLREADEESKDKILISVSEPDTVGDLVDLALMLNPKKNKAELFALTVVDEQNDDEGKRKISEKMMKEVEEQGAGADVKIEPITRFDLNVSKGILYTIKEHHITDLVLGVTQVGAKKNKIGYTTAQILKSTSDTVFIHHSVQPFNTLKRIVVAVNSNAELEDGFVHWVNKVFHISKESGLPLVFYANRQSSEAVEKVNQQNIKSLVLQFKEFGDWDDFLILNRELEQNDLFIIISSRHGHVSYHRKLDKLNYYLTRYFTKNSYIVIYPKQTISYSKLEELYQEEGTILDVFSEGKKVAGKAGDFISNLWKKGK